MYVVEVRPVLFAKMFALSLSLSLSLSDIEKIPLHSVVGTLGMVEIKVGNYKLP